MTLPELTRRLEDLERRLEIKENALNEALKEIDELKGKSSRPGRVLKDAIEPVVYEYLFDYCYDKKTGERCKADGERMNRLGFLVLSILKANGATNKLCSMSVREITDTE